jgi:cob(I)alamin adenosyltransferase
VNSATSEKTQDQKGMVIVYTGHGKGKTTAALGLAWRAMGQGLKVAIMQYIKGKWRTGERLFAETLPGLEFRVMGLGFTWESDDISKDKAAAVAAWKDSKDFIQAGVHDVIILDEITYVINFGFIELEDVLTTLKARPPHVSVVITGRNAPQEIQDLADLVTEMAVVKHPYTAGRKALRGIDF